MSFFGIKKNNDPFRKAIFDKTDILNEYAMDYEVTVVPFFSDNYLIEFYRFYKIKNRTRRLNASRQDFYKSMEDFCGSSRAEGIAERTKGLFGMPKAIRFFEEGSGITDELEGPKGLAPFFFVFDLLFLEYDGFTLCLLFGTNN